MQFKTALSLGISMALLSSMGLCASKDKAGTEQTAARILADSEVVTLNNGSGDGTVTIKVDGYGSFGSSTPAGDATYDPYGEIGPSGTVFESAVYFSPANTFLATDGSLGGLPPVVMQNPDSKTAISDFNISGFQVKLTQKLNAPTAKGSTLVQT